MVRFFALALAQVSATVVMTLSSQAANAQWGYVKFVPVGKERLEVRHEPPIT